MGIGATAHRTLLSALVLSLFGLLHACGGSGGDGSDEPSGDAADDSPSLVINVSSLAVRQGNTGVAVVQLENAPEDFGQLTIEADLDATGVSIAVDDCSPVSDVCQELQVTPDSSAVPAIYDIQITASANDSEVLTLQNNAGELSLLVLPAVGTAPALAVATGDHSMALLSDGKLLAWGKNSQGQTGSDPAIFPSIIAPTEVELPTAERVTEFEVGDAHSVVLLEDGSVLNWGGNEFSQLGRPSSQSLAAADLARTPTPEFVNSLSAVESIAAGNNHTLALLETGAIVAWGDNQFGQLGNGSTDSSSDPVQVSSINSVVAIFAGGNHSMAILEDGTLWTWGANEFGQLGTGDTEDSATPRPVTQLSNVVEAAAGRTFSAALLQNGEVWVWGFNTSGLLGVQGIDRSITPIRIDAIQNAIAITAGDAHAMALIDDGTVMAWGDNSFGQLGIETQSPAVGPIQVDGLADVRSISAGANRSMALRANCASGGSVLAWGSNSSGDLGIAAIESSVTPVPVFGIAETGECADVSLLIAKLGNGAGTVTSNDNNINCGADCAAAYERESVVELSASADRSSRFVAWGLDCTAANPDNPDQSIVTMDSAKVCTAEFEQQTSPPTAVFSFTPDSPRAGETVVFDATESSDSNGTVETHEWDFDYDGINFVPDSILTGETVSTSFPAGDFVVALRVTDNDGLSTITVSDIGVQPLAIPVARFVLSPSSPKVGELVQFDANDSDDADGEVVAYEWDFTYVGDDGFLPEPDAVGPNVSLSYQSAGTLTVALRVTDDDDLQSTLYTQTFTVNALVPPTATFTLNPTNPRDGDTVSFDASQSADSDGVIQRYAWDFEFDNEDFIADVEGPDATTPTYTFSGPGQFLVALEVTDDDNQTTRTTRSITVDPLLPPTANFTHADSVKVGTDVTFDGSSSADNDGGTIVSWEWDFNYNNQVFNPTGSGEVATSSYADVGDYTVALRVTDNDGLVSPIVTSVITVNPLVAPDAAFSVSTATPLLGELVTFDGNESSDSDGVVVTYEWDFTFNFEVFEVDQISTSPTIDFAYQFGGNYIAGLRVIDDDGLVSDEVFIQLTVDAPPTAGFDLPPQNPVQNSRVTFTSTSTDDGNIVVYAWDFDGDGVADSFEPQDTFIYTVPGTYSVSLTVTDDRDQTDTLVQTITVDPGTFF